ncbi:type 1 glutamine amidotransferase [Criibacterium bergeronii]|uniref:Lipid II isoglutaminyl synthase (glutamine-hydrolyzing) subunit GatD n=1 Tax=Criibacterium bergeronii TaxID=1871336 RepID=A0A371IP41_9FIRM|nr:glutamine amidotransferase [Criibacterium bergeronii]MBS6063385.1 glutamine amidotransferase [Peptostreptococcaceae bacterium]RDY22254.1 glutamine amidotransferase [Criibacterium bergeronii]
MEFKLLHLYHDIMDLYGDKGNIKTLEYRLNKRNINFVYETCGIGETKNFSDYDLIFMGGGADLEQKILAGDLLSKKTQIKNAMDKGVNFLLVCGGYQLFGSHYINAKGEKIDGLDLLPYHTERPNANVRCIGNIIINAKLGEKEYEVIGFENHSGQTILDNDKYFGKVISGNGNTFNSSVEGYMDEQVVGTYIHGSLLPKNPLLADFIIKRALSVKNPYIILNELDDTMENMAREQIKSQINSSK